MPRSAISIGAPQLRLLRRLCEAVAVSGDEGEVRQIILDELRPVAADYRIDALGNLLIAKRGRGKPRLRLMLDAHMDEVGFMIVAEDGQGQGLYEFEIVGGMDRRSVIGKEVVVGRQHSPAVIGVKPIHLYTVEERKQPIATDALRVDLGPGGKANVGDRGTFSPNFRRVGPSVMSKSLDDRLGVATLIELFRSAPSSIEILAAFTVQEEIGLRGAKVAASYFDPELAIVLDVAPARDLPMQRPGENTFYTTRLGFGPAIYVSDSSAFEDPALVQFLMETANRLRIPFQVRQPGRGGTNAGVIQRAAAGIPVAAVSIPYRYPHTAMSVSRLSDWENGLRLLDAAIRGLTRDVLRPRR